MKAEGYTVAKLLATLPQRGRVEWIGVRPKRHAPVLEVAEVEARHEKGLVGDRYSGRDGKRQVTLIQSEHIYAIANFLGLEVVHPVQLRRNFCVSGINLLALKGKTFRLGNAVLEYTGTCDPCSHMEEVFGPGGYNAVRGHGGITARVVLNGVVRLGDTLEVLGEPPG